MKKVTGPVIEQRNRVGEERGARGGERGVTIDFQGHHSRKGRDARSEGRSARSEE